MKNMWSLSWHNLLPCLLFMYLNFRVIFSLPINSSSPSAKLCSPEQSLALLQFKNTFTTDNSPYYDCEEYSYPKTDSWKESTDCCSWDGVTCDSFTGQVIGLDLSSSWIYGTVYDNNSLFLLHRLQKLNLACNDFNESSISSKFGQFMKLTHLNLSFSGFYGPIPTRIYHLAELVSIDLSGNIGLRLPKLSQHVFNKQLQNLTKLTHLHLDGVDMSSIAPSSLVNLSSTLRSLVISRTDLQGDFPEDIFRLPFLQKLSLTGNTILTGTLPKCNWSSSLRFLDLSYTNFSGELPDTTGNLIYLDVLDLSSTSFSGKLPDKIGNLRYLNVLDLSFNKFKGSIPETIWNCTKITSLDLSGNKFNGQVAASLSKLSQLTSLNLRGNNFEGEFPDVFGNLSKLTDLDLSLNNFSGQLPSSAFNLSRLSVLDFSENQVEGHIPFQVSGLSNLISLKMFNNFLAGSVPSWLFTLPSLETLDLSNNKITGSIEEFYPPGSLKDVNLTNNEIQGSIPNSMFELLNLTTLDLSSNNFSDNVNTDKLSKLKNLVDVDLSHNTFLSFVNQKNETFTLPHLWSLSFSSCNLNEFPIFLRTSETLKILDLSNNRIHGQITQGELEFCHHLYYLNLSHNFLSSFFPFGKTSNMNLVVLDLQSNLLQGPLVILDAPNMDTLLLSDNLLTGEVSSSICNLSSIKYLDLSNNSLSGTIPQCLGNTYTLSLLNLEMNNFHGNIPSISAYSFIQYINLNDNKLEGSLPPTLVNCSRLEVLNVGNNMINGPFPHWLAKLPELKVLLLRSNRFHGSIGKSKTRLSFRKLRIIDISHNQFTGTLPPRFFEKFNMMIGENFKGELEYMREDTGRVWSHHWSRPSCVLYYSIILTVKGVDREIDRIITIFIMMDLSNNQFEGEIPNAIGKLNSLQALNFSHNNLTGHIPLLLENLTRLESLDFSFNNFIGEIPNQLTSLSFLSVLNLSYNQFVGSIPQGNQFNTFQNDSYIRNFGLCGSPLSRKCISDEPSSPIPSIYHEEDEESSWFDWKIALMGYGCGLVQGLSIGYIVFTTRKPQWFVRKIERVRLRNVRRVEKRPPRRRN